MDGLFFPTAMRFGPDGRLYISNKGFGPPLPGEILQVDVPGVTPRRADSQVIRRETHMKRTLRGIGILGNRF